MSGGSYYVPDQSRFPIFMAVSLFLLVMGASSTINNLRAIDFEIDEVMDGWRLKRLPRVDRDILRLAYVDINFLDTPVAVACDEAVNLANKYSDTQGRKMINGVLRRLQRVKVK